MKDEKKKGFPMPRRTWSVAICHVDPTENVAVDVLALGAGEAVAVAIRKSRAAKSPRTMTTATLVPEFRKGCPVVVSSERHGVAEGEVCGAGGSRGARFVDVFFHSTPEEVEGVRYSRRNGAWHPEGTDAVVEIARGEPIADRLFDVDGECDLLALRPGESRSFGGGAAVEFRITRLPVGASKETAA